MKDLQHQHIKRFFNCLLISSLLLIFIPIEAQTLSVDSFRILENDLTANTQGTMMIDQNGEVAALIKVVTTATGFVFDGGMMGIVNTVQKTGEIWVYVPRGIQRITISHQGFGVLRDYYFPISIDKARTYEMVLKHPESNSNTPKLTAQFVVFKVQPQDAIVFIDNEPHSLNSEGQFSIRLSQGDHSYMVTAPSHESESGTIVVGTDRITKDVSLASLAANLKINTDADADVYINDEFMSHGTWNGVLNAGEYLIEIRRPSFKKSYQEVTLSRLENREISIHSTDPAYGSIEIISDPLDCEIIIDGEKMGVTPDFIDIIRTGKHTLTLRKDEFEDYTSSIEVFEDSVIHALITDIVRKPESDRDRRKREALEAKERKEKEKQEKQRREQELFEQEMPILEKADVMPSFPEGNSSLSRYISENFTYPTSYRTTNNTAKIVVLFIVDIDGSIKYPRIKESVDATLDNEAIRVVSSMPNWNPGRNEGKPVRVWQTLSFNVSL